MCSSPSACLVLILPGSINLTKPEDDCWMEHQPRIDADLVQGRRLARFYRDREIRARLWNRDRGLRFEFSTLFLKTAESTRLLRAQKQVCKNTRPRRQVQNSLPGHSPLRGHNDHFYQKEKTPHSGNASRMNPRARIAFCITAILGSPTLFLNLLSSIRIPRTSRAQRKRRIEAIRETVFKN
jgi:hypothetical protein